MIVGPSGRSYDPLPIDNTAGFPQVFPLLLGGVNYRFQLYVNAPEADFPPADAVLTLPQAQRFLVVRVDATAADGDPQTVFLRKVTPSLEYPVGAMWLHFPTQTVAVGNLNGVGRLGSNVVGGVALS